MKIMSALSFELILEPLVTYVHYNHIIIFITVYVLCSVDTVMQ